MYRELLALLNAKSENGEESQEVVEGAIVALNEFICEAYGGDDLVGELQRLAEMLQKLPLRKPA